ncbi:MAG: TetR/AcrR family transcriptional regulator [bacterium]|nr:TetR/AcrR family transcriptional regulator [bacterium]
MAAPPLDHHLRKKPIQARSRRTVESILEAANRVLSRDGYEVASTNRIAQVSGYSVGSLYQYFADKESVVRTLVDQVLVREDALLAECLAKQAGQPIEKALESVVEFLLQGRWMDAHVYRTLASECGSLYGQLALARILETQALFPAALHQLAIEHWDGLRREDLGATLWVLMAATHAVTFEAAVNPQPDVIMASLVAPLGEVWARALQKPGCEHPLVDELARRWQRDPDSSSDGRQRGPDSLPGGWTATHRLAELRALLQRSKALGDPTRFAPLTFALACLPALASLPATTRPGVSDDALQRELRHFVSALLEIGQPRTG